MSAPAAPVPAAPQPAARRIWAIVPAAGRGDRFGTAIPKQYAQLLGATVIEWTLRTLLAEPRIDTVLVMLSAGDAHWPDVAARLVHPKLRTATGGASRQDTVLNGLIALKDEADALDWALVHDAARPCLGADDLGALLDALPALAAPDPHIVGALLAAAVVDTVKRQTDGAVETIDRQGLWRALTPQVFRFRALRDALEDARRAGVMITDEAASIERMGLQSLLVPGSPFNIKVTRAEDLAIAAASLSKVQSRSMRIGQGFDVHTFGPGDHVVLGGVTIEYSRGIVAHSDGDVVIHALCDAILGALGLGDIGQHFPDTDPRYRGADSRVFLREVAQKMIAAGLRLVNADVTVLAEAPRIAKHRAAMAVNLAADLGTSAANINIKATTTEKLGFVGRGEGLAASAVALLA